MNEYISHSNERYYEGMKVLVRKSLKEYLKLLCIPTRYAFLFIYSIIRTSNLSILSLEQFYIR